MKINSPFGADGTITMRDDHTTIGYAIGWGQTTPKEPFIIDMKAADWGKILELETEWKKQTELHLSFRWISTRSAPASRLPACVVTQTTSGLIVGMLLFLVAAGLTLIFGVLKIVNFAHGTFYMLGGYVAYTALGATDSYTLAVLSGTLAMAMFGVLFERVLISRVYGSNVLMQLLICYAVVLIFDDLVKIVWGPEFHAMGMPAAFQVPPLFIAGGVVPPFYAVLIGIAALIAIVLGLGLSMTRFGKTVRAAAINPQMVSALGVNTDAAFRDRLRHRRRAGGAGRRARRLRCARCRPAWASRS